MFFIDGLGDETDTDGHNAHQNKENDAKMEIVNVLDDGRPGVLSFPTHRSGVAELPDEPD